MESSSKFLRYLLATLTVVSVCQIVRAQTVLPSDAQARCAIDSGTFGAWFESGSVTDNGIVRAPDNLTFDAGTRANCRFFERSGQMFLWLTSPSPSTYGGGSHVFNSPLFFQVLRDKDPKFRVLRPMTTNTPRILDLNLPQLGPGNIPFFFFFFDNNGEIVTTTQPPSGAGLKPFADKKSGGAMEFEKQIATGGKPAFLDKDGRPLFLSKDGKLLDKDGKSILVGKDGKPIEVGQSNQAVLMARGNRLVYYMVQVNDVFAYFVTGAKNKVFTPPPRTFPVSRSELENIKQFANSHTKPLLEPNVLTVTLKSAWVETAHFSPEERRKYITMEATVPDHDRSDNTKSVPKQPKTVELALIGMHVVFGLVGHPEKIWATFEHVNNTPHDTYFYLDDDEIEKWCRDQRKSPGCSRRTARRWTSIGGKWGCRTATLWWTRKRIHRETIRPSNLVRCSSLGC